MRIFANSPFARFVIVGMGNTGLGLAVIFAAMQFFAPVTANLIGYLVVVPLSFLGHREMSFRHRGQRMHAFLKFIAVVFVGFLTNLVVLQALSRLNINPYLIQVCAIGSHVLVTYLLSRNFVFKEHECEQSI